ncbi:bifunctional aspartate kinase/homoserine dehydrogenase I [Capnocytophaga sp. G2]|jgi:aspartate kinase|uniref:bifunctional aspartate kinase/homoserine dehydrogenase I n=1 Tax=Capnocytophaga sp. G2 TaxID=3110695 RepID=UPI002B477835|nr:bifunctional aspartate kinase/homoserine dehydrogenase I [Capnocytophaga sp. G2]MEB3005326.1 bifunctional aspartate kinase/homoserine dehydrogenase I [Capnocytophaga sp. G2]
MQILKFGGKSLANGEGLRTVLSIITGKVGQRQPIAVVVSARDKATDQLEAMLEKASQGGDISADFQAFKEYQTAGEDIDFSEEFSILQKIFDGVFLLGDYNEKIKDNTLAQGEVLSAKFITHLLTKQGIKAEFVDSRYFYTTDSFFGNAQLIEDTSRRNTIQYFTQISSEVVPIVTGFIAANVHGQTTTLGRNGSNYSASLLANFLDAEELQNYTHVDGIFTANPELVPDAKIIQQLSFEEANELANFGTSILHAKTIIPLLEKKIPLRILNTFKAQEQGTLICEEGTSTGGIRAISVLEDYALVILEGRGLLGKVGVDARIFRSLAEAKISVSIISQGSSERGIGFLVANKEAQKAKQALEKEFETDVYNQDVSKVRVVEDVGVISIVGQNLADFDKPYNALIRNQITPLLINNSATGKNVSVVIYKKDLPKAVNVIHGEIFEISKRINLAIFGRGTVGNTLIEQIFEARTDILKRRNINLQIIAIASSKELLFNHRGITPKQYAFFTEQAHPYAFNQFITLVQQHHLENLIAIDVTASKTFVEHYLSLVKNGFDLVSANKIANTIDYTFYKKLRETLAQYKKQYLYETNVGAGLPLIDTIKLLHHSGENITRIKGIFSGTLSFLFNTYSASNAPFSQILQRAIDSGYTEPDPREDLCGNDVGRKLLILARELDLENEFSEVSIENLIPETLRSGSREEFLSRLQEFDPIYQKIKDNAPKGTVLRYVGDLHGDLSQTQTAHLNVQLVSVPENSALGQVKGADSIFEIYTESYGENPIVIQGAGAGAAVTARGVFGDILRIIGNK